MIINKKLQKNYFFHLGVDKAFSSHYVNSNFE